MRTNMRRFYAAVVLVLAVACGARNEASTTASGAATLAPAAAETHALVTPTPSEPTPSSTPRPFEVPTRSPLSPPPGLEVPPGKAMVMARNFTRLDWDLEIGPLSLRVPGFSPGQGFSVASLAIDPGRYTLRASSPAFDGGYLSDPEFHRLFEFSVAAGDALLASIYSFSPPTSTFRFVIETQVWVQAAR